MDNNTDNMIGRRLDGRYELLELIGTCLLYTSDAADE